VSHCVLTAELGGEEHQFALYLGQWEELQEKLGLGPFEIFTKLSRLEFRASWLREITRLGLIGGGMKPPEAKRLVERYVDTVPFAEAWPLAFQIVARSCYRPTEEGNGKKKEEAGGEDQIVSSSALSTGTVQ
jgi:Phage tail tube protein, GTA-gp10